MNQHIKITHPSHKAICYYMTAYMTAADAIQAKLDEYKLPGLGMAQTILENIASDYKIQLFQKNYDLCARHGVDFSTHTIASVQREEDGEFYITIKPLDEIDQAQERS